MTPDLKLESFTKEVSPGVFYGSPAGKCSKRPPQVLRLLHEIRRDLASEGYSVSRQEIHLVLTVTVHMATFFFFVVSKYFLLFRNATWATFAKQDQAIQYLQSDKSKELALFVYQDRVTEQRRFLATTYKEFWCRFVNFWKLSTT